MDLFTVHNYKVIPTPEAQTISPYKDILAKDRSIDKHEAINAFAYAVFMVSPKKANPFFGYPQGDIRRRAIKKKIWGDENYQSDLYTSLEMINLVEEYKKDIENISPSYSVLMDTIETLVNTRDYLKNVNPGAVNENGTLILKPKDITGAIKEIPDIVKKLEETKEMVIAEIKESSKSRNNREIGYFER